MGNKNSGFKQYDIPFTDSEESYYWLGYICADGTIQYNTKYRVYATRLFSMDKEIIDKLEHSFDQILSEWMDVDLKTYGLSNLYKKAVFAKPEDYLQFLDNKGYGKKQDSVSKEWVSH